MLLYSLWVLISFFAVIGILGCLIGILEMLSLRKVHSMRRISLRVTLEGEEERMEYLLNTLSLIADRLQIGKHDIFLEIVDGGLSPAARGKVLLYCEKNPWVLFTDG